MLVEENKLRWWGMDMRPRWRRRVAVLFGYAGFVGLMIGLWGMDGLVAHPFWAGTAVILASAVWRYLSVFRVVKDFGDVSAGPKKTVYVNGLDQWAQYHYGAANFEAASAEQQADLLRRYRVGTYMFPAKGEITRAGLSEREKKERSSAESWTLRQLGLYLAIEMFRYLRMAAAHKTIEPIDAAMSLWSLWLLAWTLPATRVLWTETDPRELGGEMGLVAVKSEA